VSAGEVAGFELIPAPVAPLRESREVAPLHPLDGISWGALVAPVERCAMFDVEDPGKLQHWEPRGKLQR
jgi:hypothetical protein